MIETTSVKPDADRDPANRDPITGAPGAHPVGVGLGAVAGGVAAGAAAGTLAAGPIGTVVGAAVGAVVGGLGGKAVAEHFDPTVEEGYWRENHARQPYYQKGREFDDYAPAYRVGWEGRDRYKNDRFEDAETSLETDYNGMKGNSRLAWSDAKYAARAAWDRTGSAK